MKKHVLCLSLLLTVCLLSSCLSKQSTVQNKTRELTYFIPLREPIKLTSGTQNETPLSKYLNKVTGINVNYIHPNSRSTISALNILIASGIVPDIIEFDWKNYSGGPEKAIDDGVILALNDVLPKYAPDYYKYIEENPHLVKMVTTQSDKHFSFPLIREDDSLYTYMGPFIRKDWLDKLGLTVPETIAEWETVLTAFKNELKVTSPFSSDLGIYDISGMFTGAFGFVPGFYIEDDKVKYGALDDSYLEFLKLYRRWYETGLLDPDFGRRDSAYIVADMLDGKIGATVQSAGSSMGKIQELAEGAGNEEFLLVGTPYPVLNKGERPKFGHREFPVTQTAISATSDNIELACEFLNFGYTEEGKLAYNFGIPGESYNIVDGKPIYTDLILNNPLYPVNLATNLYIKSSDLGPFIQMKDYVTQYYKTPELKQAVSLWLDTDAEKHMMPNIGFSAKDSITAFDSSQKLDAYAMDKFVKFVMGIDSLDDYPVFKAEIENQTKDLFEIYQQSYDKYISR